MSIESSCDYCNAIDKFSCKTPEQAKTCKQNEDREVSYQVWVRRGSMLYRCDTLPSTDPMHPYNQLLAQGVVPEEYGIEHETIKDISSYSKAELKAEILRLRQENEFLKKELIGVAKHGFY